MSAIFPSLDGYDVTKDLETATDLRKRGQVERQLKESGADQAAIEREAKHIAFERLAVQRCQD